LPPNQLERRAGIIVPMLAMRPDSPPGPDSMGMLEWALLPQSPRVPVRTVPYLEVYSAPASDCIKQFNLVRAWNVR